VPAAAATPVPRPDVRVQQACKWSRASAGHGAQQPDFTNLTAAAGGGKLRHGRAAPGRRQGRGAGRSPYVMRMGGVGDGKWI
jgi:hypothetical protein